MSTLRCSSMICSSSSSSSFSSNWDRRGMKTRATLNLPSRMRNISLPIVQKKGTVEELELHNCNEIKLSPIDGKKLRRNDGNGPDPLVMAKLYALLEAVADREEMHKNIGEQRNNWNTLLLTSINAITLAAATMTGIATASGGGAAAPVVALKLSSTVMYLSATGMLMIMNKIQPSQLAEEQRNAVRLFKQIHNQINTMIALGKPTITDVKEITAKVLALDKGYPLPLFGAMLEKFPATIEPAVWWPEHRRRPAKPLDRENSFNGWNNKLEEEMREIINVIRKKDKADYLRLGGKVLKLNKLLAISGPLLTGLAAVGSAFADHGSWPAVAVGVCAGALASVVNTFEHGAQVGMGFEMYRSNAGFFKMMEETIESNLREEDLERRENGELFEMKVALQLGRSLSQLRDLATSSSGREEEEMEEFASKLF